MSYIECHISFIVYKYSNNFPTDLQLKALKKYFIIKSFELRGIIATFAPNFPQQETQLSPKQLKSNKL